MSDSVDYESSVAGWTRVGELERERDKLKAEVELMKADSIADHDALVEGRGVVSRLLIERDEARTEVERLRKLCAMAHQERLRDGNISWSTAGALGSAGRGEG